MTVLPNSYDLQKLFSKFCGFSDEAPNLVMCICFFIHFTGIGPKWKPLESKYHDLEFM